MDNILNTSYAQEYVVISADSSRVVLRVKNEELYNTYWKEFIPAELGPDIPPMYIRIEQVPPEVTLIDQYASYAPEMPIVTLEVGDMKINVTDRIVANTPNTEVPGLYRVDYRINISHEISSPIWAAYVSIQQRPILRRAAANWVRDSYIVKTLNRLVMEPQFMEALHAAGEPLYGFMEVNQHPSIRAGSLYKYGEVQAWGAKGQVGSNANAIFITGMKLPQGAIVVYQNRMLQLREPVWPDPIGTFHHMDPDTHERTTGLYERGNVVRSGDYSYICINSANAETSVNDENYWKQGYLYKFSALEEGTFDLPSGRLPFGKGGVEHIWVTVDDQGYSFWVDITHLTSIGAYRGYYDRKNFADYCTGDLVTYMAEGAVRLFKRKPTDIQAPETLIYPPGHYLNPAWEEVFCKLAEEHHPLLSEYFIVPHTNAANSLLSKTWSVSEEMCKAYGNMVGIPDTIVKECGAKWSALLFALLSRTRNTYEGLRICFQAVGLDVKNLHLTHPSLAYYCKPEGEAEETRVEDVYTQLKNLRKLVKNIDTLMPAGQETEEPGNLRYCPDDGGMSIQQYAPDEAGAPEDGWVTRYRFSNIKTDGTATEPLQALNNRYYKGELDILARLAEDAVADLGDEKKWVKETAWAGAPSALTGVCLRYEIPIYIWLTLKIYLYAEQKVEMQGFVYSKIADAQRGGARNIIELFPTVVYDSTTHAFVTVDTAVFKQTGDGWEEVPYARRGAHNSKIYEFDGPVYPLRIKATEDGEINFVRYWQSSHTTGLLGLPDSTSTVNDVPYTDAEHFHNVTDPDVTDESLLMMANGYVGVTALYTVKGLKIDLSRGLYWQYVMGDGETMDRWALRDNVPFVDWEDITATITDAPCRTMERLRNEMHHAVADGEIIDHHWDGDSLYLSNAAPTTVDLMDASNNLLCSVLLSFGPAGMTPEDWAQYGDAENPMDSVRLDFSYG